MTQGSHLDLTGYYLPPADLETGAKWLANSISENNARQEQINYRNQKDKEAQQQQKDAEEWKKINLIQDLTDVSKHQTSDAVTNEIGKQKAAEILQKYTAASKNLSFADLQGNISKDMTPIFTGMDAMKTELDDSDAKLKLLKVAYPSLNVNELAKVSRADILHRRLDNNTDFVNPMTVGSSNVDLTDPHTVSKYLTDTRGLDETIIKAGGADPVSIAAGDPHTNVEYSGKIPFWKEPNFKEADVKGGFLPKGYMPRLTIKSEDLPTDFLPALKNNPRKMVTADVHAQFLAQHPLEVESGTRKMFPSYDQMNDGEKKLAERDYLYTKLNSLDKNDFQYKSSKSPAITSNRTTINTGGATTNVNDVFQKIKDAATNASEKKESWMTPQLDGTEKVQNLDLDGSNLIVDFINKSYPDKGVSEKPYKASDLYIKEGNDKSVMVLDAEGNNLGTLPRTGTNLKVQPGVKEKREVVKQGEAAKPTGKKPVYKGLDKNGNPIFE